MTVPKQDLVFISCGQYRKEEIDLGKALAAAVTDLTPFEGYFAQNQTSLESLSQHIFGALNRASGFVAVMHHRGSVTTPHGGHVRASVWVEQEIAIAAFLRQALGRDLPVVVYIQKGVHREGVREQLLLGPVEFETEAQVLVDFTARIREGRFGPVWQTPHKDIELEIGYRTISRGSGAVHQYSCYLAIANTGLEALADYWVELQFPKLVLAEGRIYGVVRERETNTHILIRHTAAELRTLYPGDRLETITIEYHMDQNIYDDATVLKEVVTASFGAPGMPSVRVEKPFRELQEF